MKRLSRIKKDVDGGRMPKELQSLISEYRIADQIVGKEWSIKELCAKLNRKEEATKKIMGDKVQLGTWASRTAKLTNGHFGVVFYEVKK